MTVDASLIKKLSVPTEKGFTFIEINDIYYLEADGSHTLVVMANKRQNIRSFKSLKYFEEALLDTAFMRTHKSFLVNLNNIRSFVRGDEGYIIMKNSVPVKVARDRKDDFFQFFKTRNHRFPIVCVPYVDKFLYIEANHIKYIRSRIDMAYGVNIIVDNGPQVDSKKNIGYYKDQLPDKDFLRIHNSVIVNLNIVQNYIKDDNGYVVLNDGSKLPVSATQRETLLARLT